MSTAEQSASLKIRLHHSQPPGKKAASLDSCIWTDAVLDNLASRCDPTQSDVTGKNPLLAAIMANCKKIDSVVYERNRWAEY